MNIKIFLLLVLAIVFLSVPAIACTCTLSDQSVNEDSVDDTVVYADLSDDCDGTDVYLHDYNESDYTLDYTIYDNIVVSSITSNYYDGGKEVAIDCDGDIFSFNLTITSVNDDPVLAIPDFSTDEGTTFSQLYDLNNYVTDVEDTTFNFTVTDQNDVNCTLVGDLLNMTFPSNYTGTTTCTIRAEDTEGGTDTDTFSITINDLTSPVVLYEINALTSKYWAIITWETDEPATSIVRYGTSSGSYPNTKSSTTYTTTHSVTLDLDQNTTYYFVVKSVDSSDNSAQSSQHSLKTVADTAEPSVTVINPTSSSVDEDHINITIMTDKEATCKYATSNIGYDSMNNSFETDDYITHYLELTNLEDAHYKYYVRCQDDVGNTMTSSKLIDFYVSLEVIYEVSYESDEDSNDSEEIVYYTTSFDREQTDLPNVLHKSWNDGVPSKKYSWQINKDLFAFTDLSFYLRSSEDTVSIMLTRMMEGPTERYVLGRQVYQYIGSDVTEGSSSKLNSIRIGFKVSKKWLDINGIDKTQVKLFRYTSKWDTLSVDIVDESSDYVHYTALVPGLSLFAISYDPSIIVTTTTATSTTTTTTYEIEGNLTNFEEEISPSIESPLSFTDNTKLIITAAIFIFAILSIVLMYIYFIQPKKVKKADNKELLAKIHSLSGPLSKSLLDSMPEQKIYSPKPRIYPKIEERKVKKEEIKEEKVRVNSKEFVNDVKKEIDKSINSSEFIQHQINKNSEMLKQSMKETSAYESEMIKGKNHQKMTKVENLLIKKYITSALRDGISRMEIQKNLIDRGYDSKEMESLINSISKSLNMNQRLQDVSDKLWNMYKKD